MSATLSATLSATMCTSMSVAVSATMSATTMIFKLCYTYHQSRLLFALSSFHITKQPTEALRHHYENWKQTKHNLWISTKLTQHKLEVGDNVPTSFLRLSFSTFWCQNGLAGSGKKTYHNFEPIPDSISAHQQYQWYYINITISQYHPGAVKAEKADATCHRMNV